MNTLKKLSASLLISIAAVSSSFAANIETAEVTVEDFSDYSVTATATKTPKMLELEVNPVINEDGVVEKFEVKANDIELPSFDTVTASR